MQTVYYKAYDQSGGKRSGTVQALDVRSANLELRNNGLRPYFLHDYNELKAKIRKRQKRRRVLFTAGGAAIAFTLVASSLMIGYAGRERTLKIEDYERAGMLQGASGLIVAKSEKEREFGLGVHEIWQTFANDAVTGLEVNKYLLTVFVDQRIFRLPEQDLDMLVEQTIRALQREFKSSGCTLLVIEDGQKLIEAKYNGFTKAMTLRSYR